MSINSACNCCEAPPVVAEPIIEYVAISQYCNRDENCGELPCSSTEAVYNEEGDCIVAAQICSPNWEDLTPAEKCLAQKYLTETEVDRSGGGNHGRTKVRQYTIDEEGNCTLETICSGTKVTTTVETGTYTGPSGVPSPSCSNLTINGESEATTTVTDTYASPINPNDDCTITTEIECDGSSSSFISCEPLGGGDAFTQQCNTSFLKVDGACQWDGSYDGGDDDFDDNCLNAPGIADQYVEIVSETTITPSNLCSITTTYTNPLLTSKCAPVEFADYPAFITPSCQQLEDGESPAPELLVGQSYGEEAYNYINLRKPDVTSTQKIKYRVVHGPTPSCYLKVFFRAKIQPYKYEDCETGFAGDPPRTPSLTIDCVDPASYCTSRFSTAGAPTYSDLPPYEWNGSGNPCFTDNQKLFSACENKIYGATSLELIAEEMTSVSVEYKYSYIENYEPNWPDATGSQGCKPNGYPTTTC